MNTEKKTIVLGEPITMEQFIAVCREGAQVEFSHDYCQRVDKSRQLVERWVDEEKVMYGVTTGFGALCTKAISKEETAKLQENIILSHSVSLGRAPEHRAGAGHHADDPAEPGPGLQRRAGWSCWSSTASS